MPVRGFSLEKDDYRERLRRIEGQVRGLQRMIDGDEYCIDVLTPVRDAAAADPASGDAKVEEAVQAVERLLRV